MERLRARKPQMEMMCMASIVTTAELRKFKQQKRPITMITAYDYPSAKLVDEAGIDVILVGDSLGMVVLGYDSTVPVTLDDMIHHSKAVTRAAQRAFVVADMPFMSYHGNPDESLKNAARLMQEGMVKAVKMEGGAELAPLIRRCTMAGIPVMGHIGLLPQTVHQLGGYKIQGKDVESVNRLLNDAIALQEAGAFAVVLECIPEEVAEEITRRLDIPTIGIGGGRACDGQVLVYHDMIGYASKLSPKFVKRYANVAEEIKSAVSQYIHEVQNRQFPGPEHVFSASEEVVQHLYGKGVPQ